MKYRDDHCMPKNIITSEENEIRCTMQDAAEHQLLKLIQVVRPDLKNKMENNKKENPGVRNIAEIKWGADESSNYK